MNRLSLLMAQGMRCGHADGKKRCGMYVIGEEQWDSLDAAKEQGLGDRQETIAWMKGYETGYKWGAEGAPLPYVIERAELP